MPKERKALTHDELMCVRIGDILDLLKQADGKMPPEVAKLWAEVPSEITKIKSRPEWEKALLAVTFAQAENRRKWNDAIAMLEAEERLPALVRDWLQREKEKISKGMGSRNITPQYDWLTEWQRIPKLRAALGLSNRGLRDLIARQKIKLKKRSKKEGHYIYLDDALLVLDIRLKRKRGGESNPAEMIWAAYAIDHERTRGFAKLKSILLNHGARCEPHPQPDLADPRSFSANIISRMGNQ